MRESGYGSFAPTAPITNIIWRPQVDRRRRNMAPYARRACDGPGDRSDKLQATITSATKKIYTQARQATAADQLVRATVRLADLLNAITVVVSPRTALKTEHLRGPRSRLVAARLVFSALLADHSVAYAEHLG